jgi:hypothetical protein
MTGEALVINAAMMNQSRKAITLRSSTLMGQDNRQFSTPYRQLLLNRTCVNAELIFAPKLAALGKYDTHLNDKWVAVSQC